MPENYAREEPPRLPPGDASDHHGLTVHRADPNRSADRRRRAFALVAHGHGSRRGEAAYAEYLAALERQRRMLAVG